MACLGEGERPNQNNINEPCSAHSVVLNADSGSRSWQTLLKLFWSYLKNWGTLILHINIHITLHLMGWCQSPAWTGIHLHYEWMTKPSSKKIPNLWTGTEQLLWFDTTEGMNWEYPLLHQNPVKEGGNWGSRAQTLLSAPQRRPELTSTGCIVASNHRLPWGGGSLHQ